MHRTSLISRNDSSHKDHSSFIREKVLFFSSPVGLLKIKTTHGALKSLELVNRTKKLIPFKEFKNFSLLTSQASSIDPLQKEVFSQLKAYFQGKLKVFTLPLMQRKNSFQGLVEEALFEIPFGSTTTYSKLAQAINRPKAFRAVGNACSKNSLLLIAPCHRVLKKDKSLGGFQLGYKIKKKLLEHEGLNSKSIDKGRCGQ